jgi:hypothetical protein
VREIFSKGDHLIKVSQNPIKGSSIPDGEIELRSFVLINWKNLESIVDLR